MRADAEACRDEADRTALRAVLARLAARTPTRALDTRSRVLDAGWSAAGLGRSVRALALTGAGFALPVLAVFALVWSGALTVAPDL